MHTFSDYLRTICTVNKLGNGNDIQWMFHSGMLFLSTDKWWGDFKYRHAAHEGIDITYYRSNQDDIKKFTTSTKVPAMADGIIINVCDDFLGQTIIIEQKNCRISSLRILFAYAHVSPVRHLTIGDKIFKNDIIAQVCDPFKNPELPPHLHFSCFEVPEQIKPENLNWDLFSRHNEINILNPVFL